MVFAIHETILCCFFHNILKLPLLYHQFLLNYLPIIRVNYMFRPMLHSKSHCISLKWNNYGKGLCGILIISSLSFIGLNKYKTSPLRHLKPTTLFLLALKPNLTSRLNLWVSWICIQESKKWDFRSGIHAQARSWHFIGPRRDVKIGP